MRFQTISAINPVAVLRILGPMHRLDLTVAPGRRYADAKL